MVLGKEMHNKKLIYPYQNLFIFNNQNICFPRKSFYSDCNGVLLNFNQFPLLNIVTQMNSKNHAVNSGPEMRQNMSHGKIYFSNF